MGGWGGGRRPVRDRLWAGAAGEAPPRTSCATAALRSGAQPAAHQAQPAPACRMPASMVQGHSHRLAAALPHATMQAPSNVQQQQARLRDASVHGVGPQRAVGGGRGGAPRRRPLNQRGVAAGRAGCRWVSMRGGWLRARCGHLGLPGRRSAGAAASGPCPCTPLALGRTRGSRASTASARMDRAGQGGGLWCQAAASLAGGRWALASRCPPAQAPGAHTQPAEAPDPPGGWGRCCSTPGCGSPPCCAAGCRRCRATT